MTRMEDLIETIADAPDPRSVERDHVEDQSPGAHNGGEPPTRNADPDHDGARS
jgi:hypothetical protein